MVLKSRPPDSKPKTFNGPAPKNLNPQTLHNSIVTRLKPSSPKTSKPSQPSTHLSKQHKTKPLFIFLTHPQTTPSKQKKHQKLLNPKPLNPKSLNPQNPKALKPYLNPKAPKPQIPQGRPKASRSFGMAAKLDDLGQTARRLGWAQSLRVRA